MKWVSVTVACAINDAQIAEHGGVAGIRDYALLESALDRPRNRDAYAKTDIADLAASYAYGLASNHAFFDGNKRTSFAVTETFLNLNGFALEASDAECLDIWTQLGSGKMSEPDLADWLRSRIVPL